MREIIQGHILPVIYCQNSPLVKSGGFFMQNVLKTLNGGRENEEIVPGSSCNVVRGFIRARQSYKACGNGIAELDVR